MCPANRGHWWASKPQWRESGRWYEVSFVSSPFPQYVYDCREICLYMCWQCINLNMTTLLPNYFHLNLVQDQLLQKTQPHFFSSIICAELKQTVGPWSPQQCHSGACLIMNKMIHVFCVWWKVNCLEHWGSRWVFKPDKKKRQTKKSGIKHKTVRQWRYKLRNAQMNAGN